MDINNLPNHINTKELAELIRQDVEKTQFIVRKHADILKPFKLGRYNYYLRENVETFYNLLINNKLN